MILSYLLQPKDVCTSGGLPFRRHHCAYGHLTAVQEPAVFLVCRQLYSDALYACSRHKTHFHPFRLKDMAAVKFGSLDGRLSNQGLQNLQVHIFFDNLIPRSVTSAAVTGEIMLGLVVDMRNWD